MTTQRLRDLMEERVADVETDDLATRAWARADGVRRRRRIAVTGTAVAAVLAVAGGVAVLQDRPASTPAPSGPPSAGPSSTPSPTQEVPRAELAGTFRGAPFWWAPSAERDAELPVLQVPGLPVELSLADETPVETPPASVEAVFGTGRGHYRMLSDERMVSVDLSDRLGRVADEGGNELSPLGPGSVSPDGTQVFFRQPGRVEVWDLPSNTWRTVDTPDNEMAAWTRSGTLWLPGLPEPRPDPWPSDHQYGPPVAGPDGAAAELDWMEGTGAPTTDDPGQVANPDFLAVGPPAEPELLALAGGRNKMCCPPMGWFSHDFLLFPASSSNGAYRVLAWRVGTPDVYRVSDYTDLPARSFSASWAEDAFR